MIVCMLVTVLVWGGMVVTDEPLESPTEETTDGQTINDSQ